MQQVLDEIGVNMAGSLAEAPSNVPIAEAAPAAAQPVAAAAMGGGGGGGGDGKPPSGGGGGAAATDPAVSDLEARLNNLRR